MEEQISFGFCLSLCWEADTRDRTVSGGRKQKQRHVTDRWAFSSSSCLWGLVWTGVSWARPARARSSAYTRASDPSPQTCPWTTAQSNRHYPPHQFFHQNFMLNYTTLLILSASGKYQIISFYYFMQNPEKFLWVKKQTILSHCIVQFHWVRNSYSHPSLPERHQAWDERGTNQKTECWLDFDVIGVNAAWLWTWRAAMAS